MKYSRWYFRLDETQWALWNWKYIQLQVAYLECRDRQQMYFQIQFIELTVNWNERNLFADARNVRLDHDREHSAEINKKQ